MSNQEPPALQLKPIVSYPREAQVGKTYLVSIDVQLATPNASWDYPEEEYTIGFILNTSPYFTCEPLHDVWPTIILHRYGGTYGPAEFLLTAAEHEIERGQISITLVNGWGIPMTRLELPCEVGLESGTQAKQEIEITSRERVTSNTDETLHGEFDKSIPDLQRAIPSVELESEQATRIFIEEQLVQAGWIVQSTADIDIKTSLGIIIREFPLTTGIADYLLVIDGEAAGIIEVKGRNQMLAGAREQTRLYQAEMPEKETLISFTRPILPFSYETNRYEIRFTNNLEPEARSREIFHFHQPQTLAWWLKQAPVGTPNDLNDLLRSRLRRMPPLLSTDLRDCQLSAIVNLELSLAANRSRAWIHMASGSGKTHMAISEIYRLLNFAKAHRILYIVDRLDLAQQVLNRFQQYIIPKESRKFTDFFNVHLVRNNKINPNAEVHIATIQRLNAILTNRYEENDLEIHNLQENEKPLGVSYNPHLPIEFYDVIFIDECNRNIYGTWRPVIEYFDAFLVGLTASPTAKSFAFFQKNLVMEYTRERAIADGIIVDYDIYRIRTELTGQGSQIEQGIMLSKRDNMVQKMQYEELEDNLVYESQITWNVVAMNQIHAILTTYHDKLPELFPGRSVVPKTVIFAESENHAEDIIHVIREVFDKGDDFAKKITNPTSRARPEELIDQFRSNYNPRIVVTVNVLLGTDIKPLECIILMRPIRSRELYEQILGLGSRTISEEQLKSITPDAPNKTHFILIDAVGASNSFQQVIDYMDIDRVDSTEFDHMRATQIITGFYSFLKLHKDQVDLFKNAYSSRSLSQLVQSLEKITELFQINWQSLTIDKVWRAHQILYSSQIRMQKQLLPDMMALVCYSLQRNTDTNAILEPFQDTVHFRFAEWLNEQQKKRKTAFNDEQIRWLERIRDHIANSLQFAMDDFDATPFSFDGGKVAAYYLFRSELDAILQELNIILVFGTPETQYPL